MSSEELLTQFDKKNKAFYLTLNRPQKRNALNLTLLRALNQSLKDISKETKVVVIQANGPAFSAGLDLTEVNDETKAIPIYEEAANFFLNVYNCPLVTISKVQGPAYAGGIGLLGVCDYVLADVNATFCLPETRLGLIPALVVCILKRQMAIRHVKELCLLATPIGAERALSMGLINRATANLDADVEHCIAEFAKGSANSELKKLLKNFETISLGDDFRLALKYGKKQLLGRIQA